MSFTMNNNLVAVTSSSEVGSITAFMVPTAPTGYLSLDGTTYNTADFPELAAHLGESGATFTLPDYRGAFLRGTGTHGTYQMADGNYFAGPALGSYELDQFQGHRHGFNYVSNNSFNAAGAIASPAVIGASNTSVLDPIADGTNGTPRTGDETRPFNYGVHWCIRYAPKTALNATATSTGSISATGDVNENAGIDTYFCTNAADTGDITITLPSAAGLTGREFTFIKTDSTTNNIIIDGDGSETLNGYSSITLDCQYARIKIVSDGSNWQVKEHFFTDKVYNTTTTGPSGWVQTKARVIPYRGIDGTWWAKFQFGGTFTAASTGTWTIGSITFASGFTTHGQAFAINPDSGGAVYISQARLTDNSTAMVINFSASAGRMSAYGDAELASKPTFVA